MYALDGIGLSSTKLNGKVLEAAAEFMFVLLLILIAKGYTVTRARLPQASALKLTVFVCFYAVTYVSLFTYETLHFDRGQVCTPQHYVQFSQSILLTFLGKSCNAHMLHASGRYHMVSGPNFEFRIIIRNFWHQDTFFRTNSGCHLSTKWQK